MNKKLLILPVSLLLTSALSSCGQTLQTVSKKEANKEETKEKTIYEAIQELDGGFKMLGVVHQSRTLLGMGPTGSLGPVGEAEEQGYNVEYTFQNKERRGIHKLTYALGELENLLFYEDDEGYAYNEVFNYKNEVVKEYKLNNGDKIPYANSGFYNPWSIFNEEDFRYNSDLKRYDLNLDKTAIILNNLMYSVNSGFFGLPVRSSIKFKEGKILQFDVTMDPRIKFEMVSQTQVMPYKYDNEVTFTFEDIGTAEIESVKPVENKPENDDLKVAFDKVKDNFTLEAETKKSIGNGSPTYSYQQFKFDGQDILVQKYDDPSTKNTINPEEDFLLKKIDESDLLYSHTYDPKTQTWERNVHKNFAHLFQNKFFYEDYLPIVSGVSEDLFDYNPEKDEYVVDNPLIVNALKDCFYINRPPFISSDIDNSFKIGVRISNDGELKYVKFYFSYMDILSASQSIYNGEVKLKFSNVGSTTI